MTTSFEKTDAIVRAGANVIHIASYEWQRVRGWATGLANGLEVPLAVWSSASGLIAYDEAGQAQDEIDIEDPSDPIEVLNYLREAKDGGVVLLEDIHPFISVNRGNGHYVVRRLREMCRLPKEPRRLTILSTPMPGLPEDLLKEVPSIDLPLPGAEDLKVVCEQVAEDLGVGLDEHADALFEAARGLTVMEARLAYGQAAVQLRGLGEEAVPMVVREKERVIRQSQVLEYFEPDAAMSDVGGLENLKTWLDRRGRAFTQGAREYGLDSPKGALLLGVQGCGKSLVAKAIASEWSFPLLRFDLGKVFGGLVGQSEANIRTALQVAQALAPCVLWIDEIEKGLSGMGSSDSTDGGTTARVVGTLLTWMQEKREPVFVVATANRIEMLPPELLRKGRFDEIFFVDLPTKSVREEILRIHFGKKKQDVSDFDLSALAKQSAGYSGAELEEAVREGMFDAFAEGKPLGTDHVAAALKATVPLSKTMADQITHLRAWARVRARLASADDAEPLAKTKEEVPKLPQEMRNPFLPTSKK